MPKMTHWNSTEAIDVSPEKVSVYVAQGWVPAGKSARPTVTAMTTASVEPVDPAAEPVEVPKTVAKKAPAKKAAAKKTAKK